MKFGKHPFESEEVIQLTALVDVVFVVLIFFLSTQVYGSLESEVDVQLPTANSAVSGERTRGEIFINVKKDGKIVLNNREVTIPELQEILIRVAQNFFGGAVIIRGDRESLLGNAIAVLNCCRKADIQNVSFAAYAEEPAASP